MVNKYKYTTELTTEVTSKWWREKFKGVFIIAIICCIFSLLRFLVVRNSIYLVFTVYISLIFLLLKIKEKSSIKLEQERMKTLYGENGFDITINLKEDIEVLTPNGNRKVSYDKIEKIVETKNLIVLFIKGRLTLALKKDGFVDGDLEKCIEFLKSKKKVNRKWNVM